MSRNPLFVKLGLLVLILPALYAAVTSLFEWLPSGESWMGQDAISLFELRMAPLKEKIQGEEAVGYLGDHSDNRNADQQRNFQLTQYSLAPAMVTDKRPTRYFVSVFPLSPQLEVEIKNKGLSLVKDFGNEVRLYERGQP